MTTEFIANYRIVRKLGEGGMGVVYEGVHRHLARRVAIKVLHPSYSQDHESLSRFFTEARAANLAQHPNIVDVHEFGFSTDGRAYIVMEYLDGTTLRSRLYDAGRLGTRCLPIARQIADGVAAAHAGGVVHRDLKPENIMLVPSVDLPGTDRVIILDFGLAKVLTPAPSDLPVPHFPTRVGMTMGTPEYMSPEQARGEPDLGPAADVYSFGVILYEMLSGRLPFVRDNPMELAMLHVFGDPPPLRDLAPATPKPLLDLVFQMMRKDPTTRPSMAQVKETIENLQHLSEADVPQTLPALSPYAQYQPTEPGLPSIVILRAQQALRDPAHSQSVRRRMLWNRALLVLGLLATLLYGDGAASPRRPHNASEWQDTQMSAAIVWKVKHQIVPLAITTAVSEDLDPTQVVPLKRALPSKRASAPKVPGKLDTLCVPTCTSDQDRARNEQPNTSASPRPAAPPPAKVEIPVPRYFLE